VNGVAVICDADGSTMRHAENKPQYECLNCDNVLTYDELRKMSQGVKLNYFDRAPTNAITAEQVRLNKELTADACQHEGKICCDAKRLRWVLEGLRNHPGMNAASKAVVEAALEPWPASPKT
jgi:hypothetical protein